MPELKLYMLLLGCRPPGRRVEQHDFFFGIAGSLKELIPAIKKSWPETKGNIHIDAWREVTSVEGYRVSVAEKPAGLSRQKKALFFINLGGYQKDVFEEKHYVLLTVKPTKAAAFKQAKSTLFFKQNTFEKTAVSHIDDKFGIDVDDLYQVEDILPKAQKEKYQIQLNPAPGILEDEIHLGFLPLSDIN